MCHSKKDINQTFIKYFLIIIIVLIYTVKVWSVHTLRCFHCPAK